MLEPITVWLFETSLELFFFMPIGIIGLWRWSVWLFRKIAGLRYRAQDPEEYSLTVSLIIPVYNEERVLFRRALESWARERPDEIIAVIDHSDADCIEEFNEFREGFAGARLIITRKRGKRAALVDGIQAAESEIVVLVDSDTIWEEGVLPKVVTPFKDPEVGGVGTRQNVLSPESIAQRLFDVHLDSRYFDEIRFLAASGDALTCLSGRTAAYRRSAVLPHLNGLLHETFLGKPCISGDDKRLTHLVQAAGWRVRYQESARVFTPGSKAMSSFLKQRLRWTRNSWRADLRAMWDGWVWKRPALAFHLVDRLFQPFTTLIAPIYFGIALFRQDWIDVSILLIWWFVSRGVKIAPHVRRRHSGILMLPVYIVASWLFALVKIFALFTLNEQGWITRWDRSRLEKVRKIRLVPAYSATFSLVFVLGVGMFRVDEIHQAAIHDRRFFDSEIQLPNYALGQLDIDNTLSFEIPADTPIGAVDVAQGLTPYQLQDGDTPELLATKYGVELDAIIDPSGARAELDTVQFQMPFKDHSAYREGLNVGQNPASISYLTENNTIFVSGFGAVVDMPTLHEEIAKDALIEYEGKGVYYLKANIWLDRHTTLLLEGPELSWLKLKSDDEGYVKIESVGGSLSANGVRVSSYDPMLNDYDKKHEDGRSYILIRNGRMDFVNSDIGYLGFSLENAGGKGGVYGVSWRIVDQEAFGQELTTGYVENSRFHHNYFGIYTFGATGMVFRNNEMYENIQYGFDPHDDSNNFIIEHNYAHDNGNHGLIISRRCFNNILRWNRSENNALHGIMLDRQSNGNSIYENILAGNGDGVALWDSHNNAIFDNQIVGNTRGIRLNRLSSGNVVRNNRIEETTQYGVYVYDEAAGNQIIDNELQNNEVGIYLRSQTNHVFANSIAGSTSGVYLTTEASGNRIAKNSLTNNATGVYLKTHADDYVLDNVFVANQNNLKISSAWRLVPPGGYPQ